LLIELSHHFAKSSERLEAMFTRITRTHGKNTARAAVAREMLKISYCILRDDTPFVRE